MKRISKDDKFKFKLVDLKKNGIIFFKRILQILNDNDIEYWI